MVANELAWVDTAAMVIFYSIPLVCLLLAPRVTLFAFAAMTAWYLSGSGDSTVWLFGVGLLLLALHSMRNVVMGLVRRLPRFGRG